MISHDQPLLSADALQQPLAYEHEVDAALFLGAQEKELTSTEHLATAYYLQYRTAQLVGNVAVTGQQVAEKVEEMIENVQDAGFLRLLVNDYQTAKEPQGSHVAKRQEYQPAKRSQPRVGQILERAVAFAPVAFIVDFEGAGMLMNTLGDPLPLSQKIVSTVGGALLAGYATAKYQQHQDSPRKDPAVISSPAL